MARRSAEPCRAIAKRDRKNVRERGRERERELGGIGPLHFKTLVRSTARAGPAAAVQIDDATAAIATRAKNCSRPQMGQDKNPRTHLRTASRL